MKSWSENVEKLEWKDYYDFYPKMIMTHNEMLGRNILGSMLIDKIDKFWISRPKDFEGIDDLWDHYISTPLWMNCPYIDVDTIMDWVYKNSVWECCWENYTGNRQEEVEREYLKETPDGDLCSEDFYEFQDQFFEEVNSVWYLTWINEFFEEVMSEVGMTLERVWRDEIRFTGSFYLEEYNGDYECLSWGDYIVETTRVGNRIRKLELLGI